MRSRGAQPRSQGAGSRQSAPSSAGHTGSEATRTQERQRQGDCSWPRALCPPKVAPGSGQCLPDVSGPGNTEQTPSLTGDAYQVTPGLDQGPQARPRARSGQRQWGAVDVTLMSPPSLPWAVLPALRAPSRCPSRRSEDKCAALGVPASVCLVCLLPPYTLISRRRAPCQRLVSSPRHTRSAGTQTALEQMNR